MPVEQHWQGTPQQTLQQHLCMCSARRQTYLYAFGQIRAGAERLHPLAALDGPSCTVAHVAGPAKASVLSVPANLRSQLGTSGPLGTAEGVMMATKSANTCTPNAPQDTEANVVESFQSTCKLLTPTLCGWPGTGTEADAMADAVPAVDTVPAMKTIKNKKRRGSRRSGKAVKGLGSRAERQQQDPLPTHRAARCSSTDNPQQHQQCSSLCNRSP
jgi:hypothetical protein